MATPEQQQQLIALTIMMFNAPPGATFLAEFEGYLDQGLSIEQVAINLANTDAFNAQFAGMDGDAAKINQVLSAVGIEESSDAYEKAFKYFKDSLDAGVAPGLALHQAANFLNTTEDEAFAIAAAIFKNKIDVGFAHSVALGMSSTNISALKEIMRNITQDPTTVTQQIERFTQPSGEDNEEVDVRTSGSGASPTFSVVQSVDTEGVVSFSFRYATQPVTLSLSTDDHLVFTDAQGRQHDTGRTVSDIATAGIPPVAMSIAEAQTDGLLEKVSSYAIQDSAQHLMEALQSPDSQQPTMMVSLQPTLAQQALFHARSVALTDEQAIEFTTFESLFQVLTSITIDSAAFDATKLDISGVILSGTLDDFAAFSVGGVALSDVSYTLSETELGGVSEAQAAIIEGAVNIASITYTIIFEITDDRLAAPSLILDNYDFSRGDIIRFNELTDPVPFNYLKNSGVAFGFRSGLEGEDDISPNASQDLVLQLDGDTPGRQVTVTDGNNTPLRLVFEPKSIAIDEQTIEQRYLGAVALVANSDATLNFAQFNIDNAAFDSTENSLINGVLFMYLGGEGEQTLMSGPGINLLQGGAGNDTFVFSAHAGLTTVLDFETGAGGSTFSNASTPVTLHADKLDFSAVAGIVDYDASNYTLVDADNHALVSFSNATNEESSATVATIDGTDGPSIYLVGVEVAELTKDSFIF